MKNQKSFSRQWPEKAFPLVGCATLAFALFLPVNPGLAQEVISWGGALPGQDAVLPTLTNVVDVAAAQFYGLALRTDGTITAWGDNSYGRTNVSAEATNVIAVAAGYGGAMALRSDGTVVLWGDINNGYAPKTVPPEATNVVAIAAGDNHRLALRADGQVVAWGDNRAGQINIPPLYRTNIVAISAYANTTMLLRGDGSTVCLGSVPASARANGTDPFLGTKDIVDVSVGSGETALLADGEVLTWPVDSPLFVSNAVATAPGPANSFNAITTDGRLLLWATNSMPSSLWVPATVTNVTAVAAGAYSYVAVTANRAAPRLRNPIAYRTQAFAGNPLPFLARATGARPLHYQWFADGAPIPDSDTPAPRIAAELENSNVTYQVAVWNSFGAVTSSVPRVRVYPCNVWGDELYFRFKAPQAIANACTLATGAYHLLSLSPDGTVSAWGNNTNGQCMVPIAATNVLAIAAGGDHSLALRGDGTVVAWGRNDYGQTNVPPAATNVVAISAGWAHSLALHADGTAVAWGSNDYGQTNVPPFAINLIAVSAGCFHSAALRADGVPVTWGWDVPVPPSATNVVAIAAGWEHCLALRSDGSVIGWGDDSYGESSVPESATNVVAISAGYYHNAVLRADGSILTWGKNWLGVTNPPAALPSPVSAVAAGEDYTAALIGSGPPLFIRQPLSLPANAGTQIVLSPELAGARPLTFQWYFNGIPLDGQTNQWLVLPNVQPDQTGQYQLVVANASGSVISSVAVATITIPKPALTISHLGAAGLDLSFYAVKDVRYAVEYKDHLQDTDWQPLQEIMGSGQEAIVTDPAPPQESRFYRVHLNPQG